MRFSCTSRVDGRLLDLALLLRLLARPTMRSPPAVPLGSNHAPFALELLATTIAGTDGRFLLDLGPHAPSLEGLHGAARPPFPAPRPSLLHSPLLHTAVTAAAKGAPMVPFLGHHIKVTANQSGSIVEFSNVTYGDVYICSGLSTLQPSSLCCFLCAALFTFPSLGLLSGHEAHGSLVLQAV